jgi:hypothetical protein
VKTSPPRDRRILIWFKGHAVYGKEHGWFTAQYDPHRQLTQRMTRYGA